MASRLWITGLGHSGTSATVQILRELGVHEGDRRTEHPLATRTNTAILEWMFGSAKDILPAWLLVSPDVIPAVERLPDELRGQIRRAANEMPAFVKDPRWSWTLPFWLRYADAADLPAFLWAATRDPQQCAWSWLSWRQAAYKAQVEANVARRAERLEEGLRAAQDAGIEVREFWFPAFLEDPQGGGLISALAEVWPEAADLIEHALERSIRVDQIHTYIGPGRKKPTEVEKTKS